MSDAHDNPDAFKRLTTALADAGVTLAVDVTPDDRVRAMLEEFARGHLRDAANAGRAFPVLNRAHRLAAHVIERLVDMPAEDWPL